MSKDLATSGNEKTIASMYLNDGKSIPQIAAETGVPRSTVRNRLKQLGVVRTRVDGVKRAAIEGRLGSGLRGKNRAFTEEWKRNISEARLLSAEKTAAGVSVKPNGYVEFTRGPHKGRCVHVVVMEIAIGRSLARGEVVHHKDHNRSNNEIGNLQLMSRSEHTRLHSLENSQSRKRDRYGKFE